MNPKIACGASKMRLFMSSSILLTRFEYIGPAFVKSGVINLSDYFCKKKMSPQQD